MEKTIAQVQDERKQMESEILDAVMKFMQNNEGMYPQIQIEHITEKVQYGTQEWLHTTVTSKVELP